MCTYSCVYIYTSGCIYIIGFIYLNSRLDQRILPRGCWGCIMGFEGLVVVVQVHCRVGSYKTAIQGVINRCTYIGFCG